MSLDNIEAGTMVNSRKSDVGSAGWKKVIRAALVKVAPEVASEERLDFSLTHTTQFGKVERILNLRRHYNGDNYTGIALFPLTRDDKEMERVAEEAVKAALKNLEKVANEVSSGSRNRADLESRLRAEMSARQELEAALGEEKKAREDQQAEIDDLRGMLKGLMSQMDRMPGPPSTPDPRPKAVEDAPQSAMRSPGVKKTSR